MPVTASTSNDVADATDDRCLQASSDSRVMAEEDITAPEACSSAFRNTPDCAGNNVCTQATANSPCKSVDKAVAVESDSSDVKSVVHFHGTDDNSLDNSAAVETADSKWHNFSGDGIPADDYHSLPDYKSIHDNIYSQAVNDSISPVGESLPADEAGGAEAAVNRRRRISAARSALYHRLLSSEAAGSSDVDESADIFDVQSLCSEDDADSDASDLNLSDRSYLVG